MALPGVAFTHHNYAVLLVTSLGTISAPLSNFFDLSTLIVRVVLPHGVRVWLATSSTMNSLCLETPWSVYSHLSKALLCMMMNNVLNDKSIK